MTLTTIIKSVAKRANPAILKAFAENQEMLAHYGLNKPLRLAHFLAQMHHESAGFKALVEHRSDASSERKYGVGTRVGKILGNTQPGDGAKYKGRGIIQLTGRWNYKQYGALIGKDLVNNPELASDPYNALLIACLYWHTRKLNQYADADNIRMITKKINGGYNGFADRKYLTKLYKQAVAKYGK